MTRPLRHNPVQRRCAVSRRRVMDTSNICNEFIFYKIRNFLQISRIMGILKEFHFLKNVRPNHVHHYCVPVLKIFKEEKNSKVWKTDSPPWNKSKITFLRRRNWTSKMGSG